MWTCIGVSSYDAPKGDTKRIVQTSNGWKRHVTLQGDASGNGVNRTGQFRHEVFCRRGGSRLAGVTDVGRP